MKQLSCVLISINSGSIGILVANMSAKIVNEDGEGSIIIIYWFSLSFLSYHLYF